MKKRKRKNKDVVMGYHLMCRDGLYIVALDYDDFQMQYLEPELRRLQKKHLLSDIHILESSKKHYHAVCFDKVSVLKYKNIMADSHADEKFTRSVHYFGEPKVLRITGKGKFKIRLVKTLKKKTLREQSTPHKKLYDYHSIIKFKKTKADDDIKKLTIVLYTTKKKNGKYATKSNGRGTIRKGK